MPAPLHARNAGSDQLRQRLLCSRTALAQCSTLLEQQRSGLLQSVTQINASVLKVDALHSRLEVDFDDGCGQGPTQLRRIHEPCATAHPVRGTLRHHHVVTDKAHRAMQYDQILNPARKL